MSQLDNDLDEMHKKGHFLDVAEAYKRLNGKGWSYEKIASAYNETDKTVSSG